MKARKVLDLPIPQSGCGDTRLVSDGVSVIIEFEYRENQRDLIGTVKFDDVVAYRFSSERHIRDYCSEAYESVAEIESSGWITKTEAAKRHFAMFLSSNGYFEILASGISLGAPREGIFG